MSELSHQYQRLNKLRLNRLAETLARGLKYEEHYMSAIREALSSVQAFVEQKSLVLDLAGLNKELEKALHDSIVNGLTDLDVKLNKWADKFPEARKKAEQDLIELHALYPGIYQTLRDTGYIDYQLWGQDIDFEKAMGDVLVRSPEAIEQGHSHILLPVDDTLINIKSRIEEFTQAQNNQASDYTLFIPVNSHQSHWRLAGVNVIAGEVKEAVLLDSLSTDSLKKTPAYKHLQAAVGENIEVTAIATGEQKNGSDCLVYVASKAIELTHYNVGQPEDETLSAIVDAKTGPAKRDAFVARMIKLDEKNELNIENPALQALHDKQNEISVKLASCNPGKGSDAVEHLHELLAEGNNTVLQESFDQEMAEELQKLYRNAVSPEADLVDQARKSAYQVILKRFGLFAAENDTDVVSVASCTVIPEKP